MLLTIWIVQGSEIQVAWIELMEIESYCLRTAIKKGSDWCEYD